MSLVTDIRADENYKKFAGILSATRSKINLDASLQEVIGLHTARSSRNLMGASRYSPKTIIDAAAKDISNRARLVEIRVRNDIALSHLREAMAAIRRYIITEYADDLRDYATVDQRKALVERVLKSANELISEGESLLSTIDQFVKDLDQSGYAIKAIVECLKLLDSSKAGSTV